MIVGNRIKNKQRKLGNTSKQLVIRLVKRDRNYYDIVLSRRRAKPTSRLNRLGYYQLIKNQREKYTVFSIEYKALRAAILAGAKLHSSFSKLLFN